MDGVETAPIHDLAELLDSLTSPTKSTVLR